MVTSERTVSMSGRSRKSGPRVNGKNLEAKGIHAAAIKAPVKPTPSHLFFPSVQCADMVMLLLC